MRVSRAGARRDSRAAIRIGAVTYLNSRPLISCLSELDPSAQIVIDLPSRLADALAAGALDVALVPSIEYFRNPGATIVSDVCVASDGPVRSVMLYGRVPVEQVRTLALDEGSRTSAALTRILLAERFGLKPQIERLPIGATVEETAADAVMLIGDRGLQEPPGRFAFVWDLAEEWNRWTGLPMVFAMWIARPHVELDRIERLLRAARDEGQRRLEEIARRDAASVGLTEAECLSYFRDHLVFRLGARERAGAGDVLRLRGTARAGPRGGTSCLPSPQLLDKAVAGRRLAPEEGLRLIESARVGCAGRSGRRRDAPAPPASPTARTTSIGTSTTPTCASAGADSARFRCVPANRAPMCSPARNSTTKSRRRLALGGDQILLARRHAPRAATGVVRIAPGRPPHAVPRAQRARVQPAGDPPHQPGSRPSGGNGTRAICARPDWGVCRAAGRKSSWIECERG